MMYHCHIQIYFLGCQQNIRDVIKDMPPLDRFAHTFVESARPEAALLERSDLVLADLRGLNAGALIALIRGRRAGSGLIALADRERVQTAMDTIPGLQDVWVVPMSDQEVQFRFLRWQESCKQSRDYWETRQFLEVGMNTAPELVWYKDKNGVHEKVNDRFCRAVGKSREQVEGQTHGYIWNVGHDDPACITSEQEVMERRTTCASEEVIETGGGKWHLTTYRSPLYDVDGSVMGTVGVAVDITKERSYEQELVEKDRTMELLFSTMDCGMLCHSVDGTWLISVNQAALRLLGYESQEEMLKDGFDMVAHSVVEEDREMLRERIASLKRVGDSVATEYRVRHKDGKLLHILGNIKLVEKNGTLFYQRFLLDVTAQKLQDEKKWAEKDREIRYQEQLFEIFSTFLSNNVDDVYIMMDGVGERVEFVTPNIERVLGVSSEELLKDVAQIGRAEYITGKEITYEDLAGLEPGMALETMETERIHRKTGEKKWFRESVCCMAVQGQKRIIVYISDRTRERTTQNAMSEALEIAQVANKAKSTFLSNVSHDIRTPMNAILGFLTLMKEEADNPERVLEYTQKISAAGQHLLELINDVLDMNKIESGSAVLNIGELSMAEIIDEVNAVIRPQAKAKGQSFEIYASSLKNEHLLGDRLRINQILFNMLSNAVKYTQEGGRISLDIQELPQVDKNYSRIQFTVKDNGQGMSKEYQRVIFDPFTREQSVTHNKIQGTGLGMAITKNLVDLMNGTIRVDSRLGEGSTFTVELELRIQEMEDDPGFWEKHGVTRMIVVDDDGDICRDIMKKMGNTGVEITYATSGAQAVEMMRGARDAGRPYDLIVLDWKMPDLDGLGTAKLIRKSYPEKVPILLFTAYDWVDIEAEAQEVGIDHFLPKPFFMSNFKEAVRRMMVSRSKSKPAEEQKVQKEQKEKKNMVDGRHILIVDDIEVNRMIMGKILSSMGATYDVAEDGQKAVEKFEASQPGEYDMIFMDIQMPNMNGHEATRAIRASAHPSARSIPILAMTANAFVDDMREALEAGMDAHVPKPVVLGQLMQTIQEVLERKKQIN